MISFTTLANRIAGKGAQETVAEGPGGAGLATGGEFAELVRLAAGGEPAAGEGLKLREDAEPAPDLSVPALTDSLPTTGANAAPVILPAAPSSAVPGDAGADANPALSAMASGAVAGESASSDRSVRPTTRRAAGVSPPSPQGVPSPMPTAATAATAATSASPATARAAGPAAVPSAEGAAVAGREAETVMRHLPRPEMRSGPAPLSANNQPTSGLEPATSEARPAQPVQPATGPQVSGLEVATSAARPAQPAPSAASPSTSGLEPATSGARPAQPVQPAAGPPASGLEPAATDEGPARPVPSATDQASLRPEPAVSDERPARPELSATNPPPPRLEPIASNARPAQPPRPAEGPVVDAADAPGDRTERTEATTAPAAAIPGRATGQMTSPLGMMAGTHAARPAPAGAQAVVGSVTEPPARADEAAAMTDTSGDGEAQQAMPESQIAAAGKSAPSLRTEAASAVQTSAPLRAIMEGLPPVIQAELGAPAVRVVTGPAAGPSTAEALGAQVIDMGVSGQWIDRMASEIASLADGSGHSRFTLSPPHLGRLQVDLWRDQDATSIRLLTETDEAAQRLIEGRPALQADARIAALSLGTISVEKAATPFEAAPREQTQGRGEPSGQSQQQSERQAQARDGDERSGGWRPRGMTDGRIETDEGTTRAPARSLADGHVRFA